MQRIIGLVVAIACKPFALAWTWFRRWTSTHGKRTSSSSSDSGIYTTLANYLNQGKWIKRRSEREFVCQMHRSILGELVLTVDMRGCFICSSVVMNFWAAHAAYELGEKVLAEFIARMYDEMIDECLELHQANIDSLCDRLFS
jgi:hypothetical protein